MFRVANSILHIRQIACCHRPLLDHRVANCASPRYASNITPGNPQLRKPCPQPPPPPPKPPKDDKWVWIAMTALLLSGIGIVAAKNSPEIRDYLTLHAPWIDDLVAIIYEENYTYGEIIIQYIEQLKRYLNELAGNKQLKECSTDGKPVSEIPQEAAEEKPDEEEGNEGEEKVEGEEEEGEEACIKRIPPVVTQDICDIEVCMKDLGDFVVNNYNTAMEACSYYNSLVDETMQDFNMKDLKKLAFAMKERKGLVKVSLANANRAIGRLDEMCRYLDCGVQASKEEIENTKLLHRNYQQLYKAARIKFEWANDKALAKDRQWELVEEVIDRYVDEAQSLYPKLNYSAKRPRIDTNADMILYSAYRYITNLQDELADTSAALSERVNRAYDMLPGNKDEKKAREKEIEKLYAQKLSDLQKEYNDRFAAQKKKNDKLLADLTKKQLQKHEALLKQRIKQKEEEISAKMEKMVAVKVEAQKRIFANDLADMRQKLENVENKLNARLKAERDTRRSQQLWAAASSLLAATKKGGPYVKVNKELQAIEKASEGEDKLVLAVLKAIPPSVKEKGIVPESTLKVKYKMMEDTALKVALVEEDGGIMPVYILSWLQAMLLFMKISGIPQHEFEKPPKEPSENLDTFDLLQRARFWLHRGNLAMSLKYVDSLKGASRLAAHRWYESARAHLEVRQAAEAVLAHAAALGLQYI